MSLRNKALDSIQEEDLQELVDAPVLEDKHIEYKGTLPGKLPENRVEFLADVSAFANAAGGDLIFGIRSKDGKPVEVCGLQITNSDA